ncbi:ABC transporter permease [Bartonella sp. HY329]|uniref:ABC transporter permease n=1 Tax=unclassified Bartonella TaxID=2645622 RepID=UPI0021CA9178|nr:MULTISPECIES: ABC transporter permease [unclassified Bartonella]UXM94883.1 ABC transporter permease [Bartonella sp. HY329]UXN09206.1 ABC transporter permease [Bartonella sp. HY328]
MIKLRRFLSLIYKEILQIIRDPSSIMIAFIFPILLLLIFGYGFSLDPNRMKIGIVDENPSALTKGLVASFNASQFFDIATGFDRRQLDDLLTIGHIKGIIIIPASFQNALAQGRLSDIQIIIDGSDPNTANFLKNYSEGLIATWSAQQGGLNPSIIIEPRFRFNPDVTSRFFLIPGSIAIIMALVGTLLTSLVVSREWERGTMEAIMATPVSMAEFLAGKLIPYFFLGLLSVSLCLLFATQLFHVPFRGSLTAFYLISSAFLIPALGQGLLISAISKNQFVASQIAILTGFLPAMLLSGFIFDIGSMPDWVQWITAIVPARYLIPSLQTIFLAGNIWHIFIMDILSLLLLGAVFFFLANKTTRKQIG